MALTNIRAPAAGALSYLYDAAQTSKAVPFSARYHRGPFYVARSLALTYSRLQTFAGFAGLAIVVYGCYSNRHRMRSMANFVGTFSLACWSRGMKPMLHFAWSVLLSDTMQRKYRTWLGVGIAVWYLQSIVRKEPDIVIDLTVNQADKYFSSRTAK
jgi:hypothetical protein